MCVAIPRKREIKMSKKKRARMKADLTKYQDPERYYLLPHLRNLPEAYKNRIKTVISREPGLPIWALAERFEVSVWVIRGVFEEMGLPVPDCEQYTELLKRLQKIELRILRRLYKISPSVPDSKVWKHVHQRRHTAAIQAATHGKKIDSKAFLAWREQFYNEN
jgi:hypothetical protein